MTKLHVGEAGRLHESHPHAASAKFKVFADAEHAQAHKTATELEAQRRAEHDSTEYHQREETPQQKG